MTHMNMKASKGCMALGHSNWTIIAHKTHCCQIDFHFINTCMQNFPFPAFREKGTPHSQKSQIDLLKTFPKVKSNY